MLSVSAPRWSARWPARDRRSHESITGLLRLLKGKDLEKKGVEPIVARLGLVWEPLTPTGQRSIEVSAHLAFDAEGDMITALWERPFMLLQSPKCRACFPSWHQTQLAT